MREKVKSKKGIGQVAVILLVVVIIIVGIVVWQTTQKKSSNTKSTNSTTTQTSNNPAESSSCLKAYDNDKALCAFAEHMSINTQQYTAIGTVTNSSGVQSNYTVKNDGKGNREVSYTSGSTQVSSVTYDGSTYVQTGADAAWYQSPKTATTGTVSTDPTSGFTLNLSNGKTAGVEVTKEGTASCGSYSCYKYKVITTNAPNATQYVYFDSSKYVLREWTYDNPTSGMSVDLTFSFQPVTISKPSPIQQL